MHWQQVRTDWYKILKRFESRWDRLTEADLRAIGGKREKLLDRLKKLYSMSEDEAEKQIEDFIRKLN